MEYIYNFKNDGSINDFVKLLPSELSQELPLQLLKIERPAGPIHCILERERGQWRLQEIRTPYSARDR